MAASLNDSYILGTNVAFQNRVQSGLLATAVSVTTEGNVASHQYRLALAHLILSTTVNLTNYVTLFSLSVATDANVIADATQGGTVALTTNNIAAQEALVTDAHIDAALSGQFNSYCQQSPV